MYYSRSLNIKFYFKGKEHKCLIDKMHIIGRRPDVFYRVGAKSGNRDIICHQGQWMVLHGDDLPNDLLDALGEGIEKALQDGI
jgi:hypothetical protein